jgi:hypothetical protein
MQASTSSGVWAATKARMAALVDDDALILWTFGATIFLSALLLFSVQPLFAKMVLPQLGGSPSVWAVSMCFFQAVLLAGYCYAHGLQRFVAPHVAPYLHLVVLALAWLALPIMLPASAAEPPTGDAYLWLLGVLAVGVGLPFFAVSANAPLLQAWFARTGHPQARDPYFLYGASNLGSLLALLSYPVLVEPFIGLGRQSQIWSAGFVTLAFLISASGCIVLMRGMGSGKRAATGEAESCSTAAAEPAAPTTWQQRLSWIAYAFVPSGLLVAYTSFLTTDIASAPFLWVLPLALFLGTFVLVFREGGERMDGWMLAAQPILVVLVLLGMNARGNVGWTIGALGGLGAFLTTTMVAHRRLYLCRPEARNLTEFYLWMSFGGVLGGIFAALIAPRLFNALYELPLLLVLGMACRPGLFVSASSEEAKEQRQQLLAVTGFGLFAMLAVGLAMKTGRLPASELVGLGLMLAAAVVMILNRARADLQLAAVTVLAAVLALLPSVMNQGDSIRSFFGIHRVAVVGNGEMRVLLHGTTVHGAERLQGADGQPTRVPVPATYYYAGGPMARGLEVARTVSGKAPAEFRGGLVGLGAGSMACHGKREESWRFYEIDPVVVDIARDPARFRFLAHCRPDADVVVGDARLTLTKEPAGRFDYLVIDAFSSDAVPVHLLTVEAVRLYLSKLAPGGLLAMHVSNRHLDLIGVAGATIAQIPGARAAVVDHKVASPTFDKARSQVVLVSRSAKTMEAVLAWPDAKPLTAGTARPWTDDYSDILGAIWRKYLR